MIIFYVFLIFQIPLTVHESLLWLKKRKNLDLSVKQSSSAHYVGPPHISSLSCLPPELSRVCKRDFFQSHCRKTDLWVGHASDSFGLSTSSVHWNSGQRMKRLKPEAGRKEQCLLQPGTMHWKTRRWPVSIQSLSFGNSKVAPRSKKEDAMS